MNKADLINLLKSHHLWAKKGLSQNFLIDDEALEKIVAAGELSSDDTVIEIGSGLGVLTDKLIEKAGKVIAVEFDPMLAKILEERFEGRVISTPLSGEKSHEISRQTRDDKKICNLEIINADALKVNYPELVGENRYKVVANIPYHITSKILQIFLTLPVKPTLMVLLVQKEVAERVCAKPGGMSLLSVSVQAYGEPEIVGIVPKDSFFPTPKIDSAILRIQVTNSKIQETSEREFFRTVRIGFAARRKTLANNLSAGYHLPKEEVAGIIKAIGLLENVRAQELDIGQWKSLAARLSNKAKVKT